MSLDPTLTDTVLDVLAGICLILGSSLALIAAIGLVRFPEILMRMHAATKPQTLGLLLILLGLALELRTWGAIATIVLVAAFQLLTAPVASHMVGRAAVRIGFIDRSSLVVDELDEPDEPDTSGGTTPDSDPAPPPDS